MKEQLDNLLGTTVRLRFATTTLAFQVEGNLCGGESEFYYVEIPGTKVIGLNEVRFSRNRVESVNGNFILLD